MPSFETRRKVPFTALEMFDLVADVERYPEFLPLCEGLRVLSRDGDGDLRTLIAVMDVGYKAIRESFTSQVTLDRTSRPSARSCRWDVNRLINQWSFTESGQGLRHPLFIDYGSSRVMLVAVGSAFEAGVRGVFAEAFEERGIRSMVAADRAPKPLAERSDRGAR